MPEPNRESSSGKIQVLTVHDVATYLRLSEAKVYRLAREGGVPAFRLGRSWRFRKDLIDAWMLRETGANLVPLSPALEE
ncbi:DNA-binding protein [bacterium]|nr:DNA-binding protein [bacterium]